jgi:hypothetical protein
MNKKVFIILTNTDYDPYIPVTVHSHYTYCLETLFGFFDDFSYSIVKRFEQIETLPEDSIKLVLNLCHLPFIPYCNLSDEVIKYINNTKNTFMWVYSPQETHIEDSFFEIIKSRNISTDKLIITNSSEFLVRRKYDNIKYCAFPEWWEAKYRHNINTVCDASFISPKEKYEKLDKVTKKFLSLNRNLKLHRIWFYHSLYASNTINEGFVSYHIPSVSAQSNVNLRSLMIDWFKNSNLPLRDMLNSKHMFKDRSLDELNFYVLNHQDSIKEYFLKSLVNFTTETHFDQDFLTEKTFKSIAHSQPFIMVGDSRLPARLRARGYKTYETIFAKDVIDNYNSSVKVLKHINKFSLEELKQKVIDHREIVEYNWELFFNRPIRFQSLLDDIVWMIEND